MRVSTRPSTRGRAVEIQRLTAARQQRCRGLACPRRSDAEAFNMPSGVAVSGRGLAASCLSGAAPDSPRRAAGRRSRRRRESPPCGRGVVTVINPHRHLACFLAGVVQRQHTDLADRCAALSGTLSPLNDDRARAAFTDAQMQARHARAGYGVFFRNAPRRQSESNLERPRGPVVAQTAAKPAAPGSYWRSPAYRRSRPEPERISS
jgi:hypothetical protein